MFKKLDKQQTELTERTQRLVARVYHISEKPIDKWPPGGVGAPQEVFPFAFRSERRQIETLEELVLKMAKINHWLKGRGY